MISAPCKELSECLVCGTPMGACSIGFGVHPLGTLALLDEASDSYYNWEYSYLGCGSCGHVQAKTVVDPKLLYSVYPRVSSSRLESYVFELGQELERRSLKMGRGRLLEVGCGDGAFLSNLDEGAFGSIAGLDAARNCVDATRNKGVRCYQGFFDCSTAKALRSDAGPCDILVARHILEHVDNIDEFFRAVDLVLDAGHSTLCLEVPAFEWAVERGDFTSFTEQHISYFSKQSLFRALSKRGWAVDTVELVPNNWSGAWWVVARRRVETGYDVVPYEVDWVSRFEEALARFQEGIGRKFESDGKGVVFGAHCRASNMLHFSGLFDGGKIEGVFDDSPGAVGRNMAGTEIMVSSGEDLEKSGGSFCLIAAINFENQIVRRHQSYNGSFLSVPSLSRIIP